MQFFFLVKPDKRISLFYLANDVVQNGRKKAKGLVTAFGKAFYDVAHLYWYILIFPSLRR